MFFAHKNPVTFSMHNRQIHHCSIVPVASVRLFDDASHATDNTQAQTLQSTHCSALLLSDLLARALVLRVKGRLTYTV